MSQYVYYIASQEGGRKNRIEIQTVIQAVREVFHYETIEELLEVEHVLKQLDPVNGPLDYLDTYSLLLDVILSKNQKQLTSDLNLSTLQSSRFFDSEFHKNTYLWAGGYPRPSSEFLRHDFLIQANSQYQQVPRHQVFKVPGNSVYDITSFYKLLEQVKQREHDQKKEDLVASNLKKSTFPKNVKRRLPLLSTENKLIEQQEDDQDNTPVETTQNMLTTQNLLIDEAARTPLQNLTSAENESSVIIDELSNNYSDGLDYDDNDSEVDVTKYDMPEEPPKAEKADQKEQFGVSKSQFYQVNKEEEGQVKQENEEQGSSKKTKKKKMKKVLQNKAPDDFDKQFRRERKQSLLEVEDIK